MDRKLKIIFLILFLVALLIFLNGIQIIVDKGQGEFVEWSSKNVQLTWQSTYALIAMFVVFVAYFIVRARIRHVK